MVWEGKCLISFSNKILFARVVGLLLTLISVSKPWLQLICFCSSTQQKISGKRRWCVLRVGADTQLKNVDVLSWNLIRPSANLLSSWKGQEWRSRRRRHQTMPRIIRNQQIRREEENFFPKQRFRLEERRSKASRRPNAITDLNWTIREGSMLEIQVFKEEHSPSQRVTPHL